MSGSDFRPAFEAFDGGDDHHWELLDRGSPSEVLDRIVIGDPLGIQPRSLLWLIERAYLIDLERLMSRTFAIVARRSVRVRRSRPQLDAWLEECMEAATEQLLDEDHESARLGKLPEESVDLPHRTMARALGVEPGFGLQLARCFHALPLAQRHAFYHIVLWERRIADYARKRGIDPATAEEHLNAAAIELMSVRLEPEPRPHPLEDLLREQGTSGPDAPPRDLDLPGLDEQNGEQEDAP